MDKRIVIDPGHGGTQQRGNSTPDGARLGSGQMESRINFALAQRVAHRLGGARLTRAENENRTLGERIALARSSGAQAFISLHANPGGAGASTVWVHPRGGPRSQRLAESIRRQMGVAYGGARQVSRGDLAVLSPEHHDPRTAACLVELGYGGAPNLDGAAFAIARGASDYIASGGDGDGDGEAAQIGRRYPLVRGQEEETPPPGDSEQVQRDPAKGYVEVVEDTTAAVPPRGGASAAGLEAGPVETIVNVAKTAWDIMKDNRPVANTSSDFANAIPAGAALNDVAGWDPTPRTLRLHYHSGNVVDINTTDIYLTISWYFNGALNGVGQYINAATVIATGDVAWGNTINAVASINSPMNLGSQTQPVGALPIRIRLTESNFLQSDTYAWDGMVEGNGAGRIVLVG